MTLPDPNNPAPAQDPTQPDPAKPETGEKDWQAEAEKYKALSRKNEAQAKSNADAAKRLADIEEAQKTAEQKAADALAAAQQRAAEAEARALRAEVVAEKQVPANLAKFITGSTREELEAAADELLAAVPAARSGPKQDPSQGARNSEPVKGEAGRAEAARRFGKTNQTQ
jgi:membrane protein involved in colicin uptake